MYERISEGRTEVMNKWDEPDVKGSALILAICFVGLFLLTVFGGLAYFASDEPPEIVEVVSDEGYAKSIMIEELTGITFPPGVAKWATVTFSGTSVSIETEELNVWLGKNWDSKRK